MEYDYIYAALDRLPQADRLAMELKHFEHLTFLEIGERLGVSPNTVKARDGSKPSGNSSPFGVAVGSVLIVPPQDDIPQDCA